MSLFADVQVHYLPSRWVEDPRYLFPDLLGCVLKIQCHDSDPRHTRERVDTLRHAAACVRGTSLVDLERIQAACSLETSSINDKDESLVRFGTG